MLMRKGVFARVPAVALAGLVCASGVASASNRIANPGAEAAPGSATGYEVFSAPGWTSVGDPTVIEWTAPGGFPTPQEAGPPNRGVNLFTGGPWSPSTAFVQSVDVSGDAGAIDAGGVAFSLSGYLGGFASQNDNARCTVEFVDAGGASLSSATIGPVLAAERANVTGLLAR